MSSMSMKQFIALLEKSNLFTRQQLADVESRSRGVEIRELAKSLVEQKLLTDWQAMQLLAGNCTFLLERGRYLLLDQIGHGGMGVVYRARHMRMNREVALKVVDPGRSIDAERLARFRREIEVCSQLQHEHIVQAHDVGEQGGTLFLVLEYIEGSTLAALVRQEGRVEPPEAAAIAMQAAAGLAYAHGRGIIHRDVKPSNILLSIDGITKILDMGLARIVEHPDAAAHTELTQDGAVMGSVDFMAPEQARDVQRADARCDIYSLGATLYFLLTGRNPIPGGTIIEKLHRLANEQPQPLGQLRPDCPRELADVVERAMAKRSNERYQTAEELVRALQPFAAEKIAGRLVATTGVQTAAETHRDSPHEPTVEYRPAYPFDEESSPALSLVRRTSSPKPFVMIAAAAALLAIVAGLAIWQFTTHTSRPRSTGRQPEHVPPADNYAGAGEPPDEAGVEFPGHYGGIWSVAWSPDGRYIATGGGEGDIRIWDPQRGVTVRKYTEHRGVVYALVWSPDSRLIASGDGYGKIHVWNTASRERIASLERHGIDSAVANNQVAYDAAFTGNPGITFSPDGRELAYGDAGKVVRYNLASNRIVGELAGTGFEIDYSPSGKRLLGGHFYGDVTAWNLETGQTLFRLPEGRREFCHARFVSDDALMIADVRKIEIWNLLTGAQEHEWTVSTDAAQLPNTAIKSAAPHLQLTPDRRDCLVALVKGVKRINLETGQSVWHEVDALPKSHNLQFWRWAASPDAAQCISAYYNSSRPFELALSQIADGRRVRSFGTSRIEGLGRSPKIHAGRFLQTTPLLDERVQSKCWDLFTGRMVPGFPRVAHVDANGRLRALELEQGVVELRPLPGQEGVQRTELARLQEPDGGSFLENAANDVRRFHWTEDGKAIWTTSGTGDARQICFWNADNGEVIHTRALPDVLWFDAKNSKAEFQVSATGSDVAAIYGPEPPSTIVVGYGLSEQPLRKIPTPPWSGSAAIAPDGRIVLTDGGGGLGQVSEVILWEVETGRQIASAETGLRNSFHKLRAAFSRSGRYVTAGPRVWELKENALVPVWEVPEAARFVAPDTLCQFLIMFPDERHVLVMQDARYQVWDWRAGRKRATLYLMPRDHWAFVNHETGHWNGSDLAFQSLRFRHTDKDRKAVWLTPLQYEQQTGWANDPDQAGLNFSPAEAGDSADDGP